MADDASFDRLLNQFQAGDQTAATRVFERFSERLIALARSRLSPGLQQKVDPEDVVQSVFKSFFRDGRPAQFSLDDWSGLWGLLVTMTVRKCGRRAEEFYTARRDIRRELIRPTTGEESAANLDPPTPEPTPLEALALSELLQQVMHDLDARGRQVLSMRLQGYTVPEISQEIGRTERTVHRSLDRIKDRLEALLET